MSEVGGATVRSRQVAAELRRLRKAAALTTGEVGRRLGVSQSKISRIENSQLGLHLEEVAAMLGLYQVPAERREQILRLVRQAAEPGWVQMHGGGLPDQWQVLIDWESRATALRNYEPLGIPGLLQTADYARAIIAGTANEQRTESELDTKVAARLGRQGILSRAIPPSLHVVLYEPALRMPVGGGGVMAAQLRHLAELAQRPRVTVQVVPLSAGPHPGMEGPFMLMDFETDPSLIYVENKVQSIFIEQPPHITAYNLAWQRILEKALAPKRSAQLIASMVSKAKRQAEEQQ
jgi:transcriptional regulator with XRE-family HTH domain